MTARPVDTAATETATKRPRSRFWLMLSVIGPGVIAASAGNDSGGISTYSQAGAKYGYSMLWMMLLMTFSLVIVQEMAGRMGAVTGKGFAALIRERFGVRPTFLAMLMLLASNAATSVAEFAGIAAAMELFGVSKYVSVPLAAVIVWLLVVRGSFHNVEKVLLALSLVFVSYIVTAFAAKPDWLLVGRELVTPQIQMNPGFFALAVALTGTTVAPWMQFFVQSNIVDKGTSIKEWALAKWDVIAGAIAANFVAIFIIVTTATVLHPKGVEITEASKAAIALTPLVGQYATILFAIGLLAASVLAACVLPLTAGYSICEAFGWEAGVDRKFSEAPIFIGIYTFVIAVGAALILIPGVNLISVMITSQVINGVMLPFLLIFMMVIVNDRRIMGAHVNGRVFNAIAWLTIGAAISLTVILLVTTALGMG
jgi:NRAMP (natural resistance-associated macrophage protein)-like metal ion transporter